MLAARTPCAPFHEIPARPFLRFMGSYDHELGFGVPYFNTFFLKEPVWNKSWYFFLPGYCKAQWTSEYCCREICWAVVPHAGAQVIMIIFISIMAPHTKSPDPLRSVLSFCWWTSGMYGMLIMWRFLHTSWSRFRGPGLRSCNLFSLKSATEMSLDGELLLEKLQA